MIDKSSTFNQVSNRVHYKGNLAGFIMGVDDFSDPDHWGSTLRELIKLQPSLSQILMFRDAEKNDLP